MAKIWSFYVGMIRLESKNSVAEITDYGANILKFLYYISRKLDVLSQSIKESSRVEILKLNTIS